MRKQMRSEETVRGKCVCEECESVWFLYLPGAYVFYSLAKWSLVSHAELESITSDLDHIV